MRRNINRADRLLRLAIALLLLGLAYWQWSWLLLAASLFVFFEALFSWCILYQLLGKSSCPRK
jgi:hypothetical protein